MPSAASSAAPDILNYSLLYTLYSILYTLYSIPYTLYHILYTQSKTMSNSKRALKKEIYRICGALAGECIMAGLTVPGIDSAALHK